VPWHALRSRARSSRLVSRQRSDVTKFSTASSSFVSVIGSSPAPELFFRPTYVRLMPFISRRPRSADQRWVGLSLTASAWPPRPARKASWSSRRGNLRAARASASSPRPLPFAALEVPIRVVQVPQLFPDRHRARGSHDGPRRDRAAPVMVGRRRVALAPWALASGPWATPPWPRCLPLIDPSSPSPPHRPRSDPARRGERRRPRRRRRLARPPFGHCGIRSTQIVWREGPRGGQDGGVPIEPGSRRGQRAPFGRRPGGC
jgi:hypothetical protein